MKRINQDANVTSCAAGMISGWIVLAMVGCGDPIRDGRVREVRSITEVSTEASGERAQSWPMRSSGYFIKPMTRMKYVSAIAPNTAPVFDPDAEKVPWDESKMTREMNNVLNAAIERGPMPTKTLIDLTPDQFAGSEAFDMDYVGSKFAVLSPDAMVEIFLRSEDWDSFASSKQMEVGQAFAGGDPPIAVRFCENSEDMLVMSKSKLVRISGETGKPVGTLPRPEDEMGDQAFVRMFTNLSHTLAVLLTDEDRLYICTSKLDYFELLEYQPDETPQSISISQAGDSIGVVYANQVDHLTLAEGKLENVFTHTHADRLTTPNGAATAPHVTVTTDRGQIRTTQIGPQGQTNVTPIATNFWCEDVHIGSEGSNMQILVLGKRINRDGQVQNCLFNYYPMRMHSSEVADLDHQPILVRVSSFAQSIATLGDDGHLRLVDPREFPRTLDYWFRSRLLSWINAGQLDEFQAFLDAVKSQRTLLFNRTPWSIHERSINTLADRWGFLEHNEPELEALKPVREWLDKGSIDAKVCGAIRHYRAAWDARGTGYAGGVDPKDWEKYETLLAKAKQEGEALKDEPNLPLVYFSAMFDIQLESEGSLESVESICRETVKRFPGELEPHDSLLMKLLPRWFGQEGDAEAMVGSVAEAYDSGYGDWIYMVLLMDLFYWEQNDNGRFEFDQVNVQRLVGAVEWAGKTGMNLDTEPLTAAFLIRQHGGTAKDLDAIYRYEMSMRPMVVESRFPRINGLVDQHVRKIQDRWEEILGEE